jgi:proline iminopeptidase
MLPGSGFYVQEMTLQSFSSVSDPRPKLKDNLIPVLILKGQCDNQRWGFTQEYLQVFPNSRLEIIADAGHAISWEQPERYTLAISRFLQTLDSLHATVK